MLRDVLAITIRCYVIKIRSLLQDHFYGNYSARDLSLSLSRGKKNLRCGARDLVLELPERLISTNHDRPRRRINDSPNRKVLQEGGDFLPVILALGDT